MALNLVLLAPSDRETDRCTFKKMTSTIPISPLISQGKNGTFQMFIEGDMGTFEITPQKIINEASFLIRVKNSSRLDYETIKGKIL